MRVSLFLFFVSMLFSKGAASQEWKQYADSGKYYVSKQNIDKAIDFYDKAKLILERDSLWTMSHLTFCQNYGLLLRTRGYIQEAEPYYREAMEIAEKIGGKNVLYTKTCNNIGLLYLQMGKYSRAESMFLEARELNEKLEGRNQSYGTSCNNLGLLFHTLKEYQKAEQFFTEAQEVFKIVPGPESSHYLAATNSLGTVNKLIGQYEKAISLLKECVFTIEKIKGKTQAEYANFTGNLAAAYLEVNNYEQAEFYFLESRNTWEKLFGNKHPFFAQSLNNLGALYRKMANFKLAEENYLQAKKIMEEGEEIGEIHATVCNNLGELYLATDRKKALVLLRKSFDIRQDYGIRDENHINNCDHLGDFYADINLPDSAIKYYLIGYKAQLDSRQSIFSFTSEQEKKTYLETIDHFYDKLTSLRVKYNRKIPGFDHYDYILANRSLLLQNSLQMREQIRLLGDEEITRKYNEWVEKREELYYWLTKPIYDRNGKDSILLTRINELEKLLVKYSSKLPSLPKELSYKNIRGKLGANEAAIEFSTFRYFDGSRKTDSLFYYALVVRKDLPEPLMIPLFEKKSLERALVYKTTSAGQHQLNYLYNYNAAKKTVNLYDIIWKPLQKSLTGMRKIYFSPAGELYKISFAGLAVSSGSCLSDKYEMVRLNTTADVQNIVSPAKDLIGRMVLFGGVQYDVDSTILRDAAINSSKKNFVSRSLPENLDRDAVDNFYFLDGSEIEITNIGQMAEKSGVSVNVSRGIRATEEAFKEITGKSSPSVLHLATHGFFFPDPKKDKSSLNNSGKIFRDADEPLLRSGLALAGANLFWKGKSVEGVQDGILTAYEVANMYLPNTKLAVLSACETGLGDIQGSEGVYGLQRAFKIAGVENLLMSLWKVPDMETAEFMQAFYKNIFSGKIISEAFYSAQQQLKNKYRNEPYKWAAWILVR